MLEVIDSFIRQPIWSVFTALLGFFFGHRFSLWRDRRREFNEVAEELFVSLERERARPSPLAQHPSGSDFARFRRRLGWWHRRSYDRAVSAYQDAKQRSAARDASGGVYYSDTGEISRCAEALLEFTERK